MDSSVDSTSMPGVGLSCQAGSVATLLSRTRSQARSTRLRALGYLPAQYSDSLFGTDATVSAEREKHHRRKAGSVL